MDKDGQWRQALPELGPKGQAVIDHLLARVTELECCEHAPLDFAFWIATRPGRLLCDSCYQTAQLLADHIKCAACGQSAGDPSADAIVVARVAARLAAQFQMCTSCVESDLRHAGHPT